MSVRALPRRSLLHASSLLLAALCGQISASAGEGYHVGSTVPPFSANDQFGQAFQLNADCRFLLVSFDMGTGKQANAKLTALGKDYLPNHRAVYVASIAGMPAIGRTFALPKMRRYTHRIVLAEDAALLAPFPRQDQRVTVLGLKDRKITSIRYWNPEKESVADFVAK